LSINAAARENIRMIHRRMTLLGAVAALAVPSLPRPAAAASTWSVGWRLPADLRFIDGNGGPVGMDVLGRGVAIVRIGGLWCPPCRAERPEVDAFEAAHPRIPIFLAVSAGRGISVEDAFQAEIADFRRRGRDLARVMRRDPMGARIVAPPQVPHTLVLRDGIAIESLSGIGSYQGRRSFLDAAPTWRTYVEAVLLCAAPDLLEADAVLPASRAIAQRRAPDACRA
jgi:thiol-disulfide isomerase/thioredoxin